MALLTSFMSKESTGRAKRRRFAAGQLTIIDPSDPFIDPAFARGLFEIIIRIFVRSDVGTGKVLLVDEAHKVCPNALQNNRGTDKLTSTLPRMRVPPASQTHSSRSYENKDIWA
jgi:hypothetical protein